MFAVKSHPVNSVKYVGRSIAKVIDNVDPNKRGRIRVHHPILGETVWIPYLKLAHVYDVPEVDDLVYIECDCGSSAHPVAWGNLTKGADSSPDIPEVFKRHKPTNKGFYTKGGHLVELDDGTGLTGLEKKGIRITTSGGKKFHLVEDLLAQNNSILISDEADNSLKIDTLMGKFDIKSKSSYSVTVGTGATLTIDGVADKIELKAVFGDSVSISAADGIQASTPTGTSLSMKNGAVELKASTDGLTMSMTGETKLTGAAGVCQLILKNGQVELKGASAGVVDLIFQLAQALSTDTYAGFGAPATNVATYAQIAIKAQTLKAS